MKVLIITEEDVFYIFEFFKAFYPRAAEAGYTIDAVTILPPFNKRSWKALAAQMWGFYGPINFFRMGTLFVFRKVLGMSVAGLTSRWGIERLPTRSVNDPAFVEKVKARGVDVIVSIAAPQIFRKNLIRSVPRGCINSHSALLPENRGMMPVFWGLYKGDTHIGVTIHVIDEELDKGDILAREKVPVGDRSLHEMILLTKRVSARLVDQTLRRMVAGEIEGTPMSGEGSYQSFPAPAEVKEFKRRGKRIM